MASFFAYKAILLKIRVQGHNNYIDNSLKFTNRLIKSKKSGHCFTPSKFDEACTQYAIALRLTKPHKKNGRTCK
ncbi:MAG: hypothetical protein LBB53_06460 [Prevotellaceae bacterium]|nr:hypothetical protein [Prevotellaceae bacterium]